MEIRYRHTVDRRFWIRGEGTNSSALALPDGRMCCLGHMLLQRDPTLTKLDLLGHLMPRGVAESHILYAGGEECHAPERQLTWTFFRDMLDFSEWSRTLVNTRWVNRAAELNDDPQMTDTERELELIYLCRDHGIELTFIN